MTRKQLVNGLRALHESDNIYDVKFNKKRQCVILNYTTAPPTYREGQLIISYATEQRLQTKPK